MPIIVGSGIGSGHIQAVPKPKAAAPKPYVAPPTSISAKVVKAGTKVTKALMPAKKSTTTTTAPNYSYITNQWKPLIDTAVRQVKQHYVDTGLQNSTAAAQSEGTALAPITNGYAAAMEAARQADMNRATDIWKSMQAIGASRGAITGKLSDYQTVKDLPWFSNLFSTNFLAPAKSTGPTGDPTEQSGVPRQQMFPGRSGKNMAGQAMDQQARLAADSLAEARRQFDILHPPVDPHADPTLDAITGIVANPGALAGHPSTLLNLFMAKYGVNVEEKAKTDPRYLAIYKVLYPATWDTRLHGESAAAAAGVAPTATPAPAGQYTQYGQNIPLGTELNPWNTAAAPEPVSANTTAYGSDPNSSAISSAYAQHMKSLGLGKGVYWK